MKRHLTKLRINREAIRVLAQRDLYRAGGGAPHISSPTDETGPCGGCPTDVSCATNCSCPGTICPR